MDSQHPYSHSSSYIGLLNSQNDSVPHSNFPYEIYPSSEIPPFSSQYSDARTSIHEETPVGRRERRKWTPADDEVLISAWLNTSKDIIVGNEQKLGTFWRRVGEYYAASPHARATGEKIEHLNLKQRWHRINDLTNKFCGSFGATERENTSGMSENDVLQRAHQFFYSDYKLRFNLEHAWCLLRFEQKWLTLNTSKVNGSAKRKVGEEVSQNSSMDVGDEEIRPEGIKAAKVRMNSGGKGKAPADYDRIWEIKKDDLAMKEKLSKLAILDTLLAKKEPLTEAEEIVKNKLLLLC